MNWYAVVSAVAAAGGFVLSYLSFLLAAGKTRREDAESRGAMLSEIRYIRDGIDGVREQNREISLELARLSERLTRVEESVKQAHKRLDCHDGHLYRGHDSAVS